MIPMTMKILASGRNVAVPRNSMPYGERQNLRSQLFSAPRVQGYLLMRTVWYCSTTSIVTMSFCCVATANDGQDAWRWFGAAFFSLVVVLPLALYDAARSTNQIIGPMARAQGTVRQLANGDPVHRIDLRGNVSFWDDWMKDFNDMIARVQPQSPGSQMSAKRLGDHA